MPWHRHAVDNLVFFSAYLANGRPSGHEMMTARGHNSPVSNPYFARETDPEVQSIGVAMLPPDASPAMSIYITLTPEEERKLAEAARRGVRTLQTMHMTW